MQHSLALPFIGHNPVSCVVTFDFDGVLIESEAPLNKGINEKVMEITGCSFEEADKTRQSNFIQHGCTFTPIAEKLGKSRNWVNDIFDELYFWFIDNLDNLVEPSPELIGHFEDMEGDFVFAILTQSYRDEYTIPALEYLRIKRFFQDALIVGDKCVDGKKKKTAYPHLYIESRLGAIDPDVPRNFVEDNIGNLTPAMALGTHGILVGHSYDRNTHIDVHGRFPTTEAYLAALKEGAVF